MPLTSSHSTQADRNLLLGILALQMDFVSRDALIAAMNAWVLDKSKSLGEMLVTKQALSTKRLALLDSLVEEHLAQHDQDPEKSIAAVGAIAIVREKLAQIADGEAQATLSRILGSVAPGEKPAPEPTIAFEPKPGAGCRFTILRPHAKGGLGEVFVALDDELNREVALKEIQAHHAQEPASRARFVQEAGITGRLEHPAIVPVYGFGQYPDGRPYYAMRFIEGESLKQAIARFYGAQRGAGTASGPKAPAYASAEFRKLLGVFVMICQAVHYAHSRGIIHRDIKPDNILLGKYGEALLVDWAWPSRSTSRRARPRRWNGLPPNSR